MTIPTFARDDDPVSRLPRHTTPTWEVELLISGVAVFAMLQLAGWLNDQYFTLVPRFGARMEGPLLNMYLYAESASVILAVTFVVHLMLRARWIALVGIHSVYPDGVDAAKLRIGTVQRAMYEKRPHVPADLIERADNLATLVFAVGVHLALTLLLMGLIVASLFGVTMAIAYALALNPDPRRIFIVCAAAFALPFVLTTVMDGIFGDRLRPEGLAYRLLTLLLRGRAFLGMSRTSTITALMSRHGGQRRVAIGINLVLMAAFCSVILGIFAQRDPERMGAYALFPDPSRLADRTVDAAHYDDRRDPIRDKAVPYVQSAVIIGAYLRLTVPYEADHDDRLQRANCPAAVALPAGDTRAAALLDCLQGLHPVMLDGKPLASLRYDVGSDARTDRPALVAMIDVRGLAVGRHELSIARPRLPGEHRDDDDVAPYRIPFWR